MQTGTLVKKYLEDNGIKQNYIARIAGYNDKTFSNILNGNRKMLVEDLSRISSALNVNPSIFLPTDSELCGS